MSMVENFKQRAFGDCWVTLGDTKDSLQGVSVASDVAGSVRVFVCGVCVRVSVCGVCVSAMTWL